MKILISSDSTCDLGGELADKYGVAIMPLKVILGEQTYSDGVDITPEKIFSYVKETGVLPKTSAPSAEEYGEFFAERLKSADAVIHINISDKASSSHQNAVMAAKEFGKRVTAFDSRALSTGQGLLVLKACDFVREGKSPEEAVALLEELRGRVNTSFVPDRLDYLHKGGRCSLAALMGAKALKLHPLVAMQDGQLKAAKKYMGGLRRCLKNYVCDLAREYPFYDRTRCFITHSSCEPEVVEEVRAQVKELFEFNEVLETRAGSVVSGHCGKNTLGVLFIYEKASK